MRRHQLLLVQTGAAALDAVQILVDLVRAIEGDFHQHVARQRVECDGRQAVVQDVLPRLVASRHEADGAGVDAQRRDGFDDVHDCGARADADVFGSGVEVVVHGADGGVALCSLYVHGCGGGGGPGVLGGRERVARREAEEPSS